MICDTTLAIAFGIIFSDQTLECSFWFLRSPNPNVLGCQVTSRHFHCLQRGTSNQPTQFALPWRKTPQNSPLGPMDTTGGP